MTRMNTKLTAAIETYLADLRRVSASGGATGERSNYGTRSVSGVISGSEDEP